MRVVIEVFRGGDYALAVATFEGEAEAIPGGFKWDVKIPQGLDVREADVLSLRLDEALAVHLAAISQD